jgi:hypothetical protein
MVRSNFFNNFIRLSRNRFRGYFNGSNISYLPKLFISSGFFHFFLSEINLVLGYKFFFMVFILTLS